MKTTIPCVLMRAGSSRGPFFLREWLPEGDEARDQALIGAIGASDPLHLDGVGGGSTLNCKVAIVSRSSRPDCDVDYLFAQVGVGHRSVDTRPNCGNMLAGVVPFAIEQGLLAAGPEATTARVHNVNTGARIDVTVRTPGGRVTYDGDTRIDGVPGSAAPILLDFLDAWGAVTGRLFPTGQRIDLIDGVEVTCIDAAMPLMMVRARDLGVTGREKPVALDADAALLQRLEALRLKAGAMMGLGDVSRSVVPKPVLVSDGDDGSSITSRYFTPHKCHASHAVTGAIGVATAFALPGTVASGRDLPEGSHGVAVLHPQGRIDVQVEVAGRGGDARVIRAALVRTARKILQGELHLPGYVFPRVVPASRPAASRHAAPIQLIVPTSAGGGNDVIARIVAAGLAAELGQPVDVDNRPGAAGSVAAEYVARAPADGRTLLLGSTGTHALRPALHHAGHDPVRDFTAIGLIAVSPTLMVANARLGVRTVGDLLQLARREPGRLACATAGEGSVPHLAAAWFQTATETTFRTLLHAGAAPAIADTAAGTAQLMFPSLFTAEPFIRTGALVPLAVAGPRRLAACPSVPTLEELGLRGADLSQWYALFAPAGLDDAEGLRLNAALTRVLARPEVLARLQAHGAAVKGGTQEQLGRLVRDELVRWGRVAGEAGLEAREPELAEAA